MDALYKSYLILYFYWNRLRYDVFVRSILAVEYAQKSKIFLDFEHTLLRSIIYAVSLEHPAAWDPSVSFAGLGKAPKGAIS